MNILTDTYHLTCELASTLGDVHLLFKQAKYDVVVMDPAIENGSTCLEYMLSIDSQQRMLMVSATLHKSDPLGCEHCVQNYRRRQLNSPTAIKNIARMIEGFDHYTCDWYDIQEEASLSVDTPLP